MPGFPFHREGSNDTQWMAVKRLCAEMFLRRWKEFDVDMEKKYRQASWTEFRFVVRVS